ncbi:hypothetical protein AAU57_08790 [Nonlabens sp. YIK11]|uniref:hypothetical protein n=1 Tax=Nonlabens sp. YIK11 TaxID=1453349 RepID=UPI0006DC48C0|nr:hypothetical protein [Nonlabens sp. YIK11]KQC33399.1 hypothetical protein AAU57_08790 [Nonlabens sp. YIK11]
MEEIKNYKLVDFLKQDRTLIDDYVSILSHSLPVPTKKELWFMKLKHVEFIKQNINSTDDDSIIQILKLTEGIKKKEVLNMTITKFFGKINSVKQQLETISKAEQQLESDHINPKWEAVDGSKRMAKFGILNILDNLANGDILKWEKVKNLQFSDVFTKLLMDKTKNDIQIEMNNVKIN